MQVTGDILRLHTRLGGRVLPGFGPSSHAEAVNPAAAPLINPGVVEWLMPPQMKHPDILAQVRERGEAGAQLQGAAVSRQHQP